MFILFFEKKYIYMKMNVAEFQKDKYMLSYINNGCIYTYIYIYIYIY